MKPLHTNSLSAWGYIGLFILFSLPYVGTPALIICAFFVKDTAARNFSRALLILTVAVCALLFVLILIGLLNVGDLDLFYGNNNVEEAFRGISGLIG